MLGFACSTQPTALFPTWLAAAGQAVPAPLPGRILAELFTEPPTPERVENRPPEDAAPIAPGAPIWAADALMGHLLAGPLATEDRPPQTDPRRLARQRQRLDWHRAQSLLDAGLAQQALPIVEDLQRAFPEHPLAALQLAETRIQLGDLVGARQAAAALLDQAPGALPARLLMARLEREAGHHEAALEQLTQAEAEGADSAQLHSQIGYTQLYLRRWAEAAASYARALSLSPDDLGAHLGRARALLALRRFAEAREHALAAVGVDFHRPLGHFYLGLGRDELIRLVERYQRGLRQFLAAAPHVDLVELDDKDLGLDDDDVLQAHLSTQLGPHRVSAFAR